MGWNHQLVSQKRYLFQIMIPEFWYFFVLDTCAPAPLEGFFKPPNFRGSFGGCADGINGGAKLESFLETPRFMAAGHGHEFVWITQPDLDSSNPPWLTCPLNAL